MEIEEIIELVLDQVYEQGWSLLDEYAKGNTEKAIGMVYDAIKDELY